MHLLFSLSEEMKNKQELTNCLWRLILDTFHVSIQLLIIECSKLLIAIKVYKVAVPRRKKALEALSLI